MQNPAHRWFALSLLSSTLALAAGCGGGGEDAKNEVSGKVTVGSQPVAGIVIFYYPDGVELSAPTNAEGHYTIPNAKTGSVKVYVKALPGATVRGSMPKGGAEMPKDGPATQGAAGVPPPARYTVLATSGLSYEVKGGKQTYDIPLK
jgi:hypothetical protein